MWISVESLTKLRIKDIQCSPLIHWHSQRLPSCLVLIFFSEIYAEYFHSPYFPLCLETATTIIVLSHAQGLIWAWWACYFPGPPSWQQQWHLFSPSPWGTSHSCLNFSKIIESGLAMTWANYSSSVSSRCLKKVSSTISSWSGTLTIATMWRCGCCLWRSTEKLPGTWSNLPLKPYSASADAAHSCSCWTFLQYFNQIPLLILSVENFFVFFPCSLLTYYSPHAGKAVRKTCC